MARFFGFYRDDVIKTFAAFLLLLYSISLLMKPVRAEEALGLDKKVTTEGGGCLYVYDNGDKRELDRMRYGLELPLFLDVDNDYTISRIEVAEALAQHLTPNEKAIFRLYIDLDDIMSRCDADKDGVISMADFFSTTKTCLADCTRWSAIEMVMERIRHDMAEGSKRVMDIKRIKIRNMLNRYMAENNIDLGAF